MTSAIQAAIIIIAIGTLALFVFSITLAMIFPGYWPTYELIIKNFTWPAFTFGAGLLTGTAAHFVTKRGKSKSDS